MALVDPMASLLTVCENGHGKRTSFDEYRVQSRGGLGIINIRTTGRNGKVVGMKSMRQSDELMLITLGGMIVRTGVSELRMIGRATQGVRIIALKEDDKLTAVARVVTDDSNQGDLTLPAPPAQGELRLPTTPGEGEEKEAGEPAEVPDTGGVDDSPQREGTDDEEDDATKL
jgi:DNA gyrase subunit A